MPVDPHQKIEIALVGVQSAYVIEGLECSFVTHKHFAAADPLTALREIGPRIRGAVSHGMAGISRAQIELMPNLEICAIHGVGLETTDLAACRERHIVVTIASVLYDDVADLAIALALAACRKIAEGDRYVRSGQWLKGRLTPGRKLTGMRAGIIG